MPRSVVAATVPGVPCRAAGRTPRFRAADIRQAATRKTAKSKSSSRASRARCSKMCRALSSLHRLSASNDLDAEMVGRLVQRAPDEARTALKPFGYYEPEGHDRARGIGRIAGMQSREDRAGHARHARRAAGRASPGSGKDEPFLRDVARALAAAHGRAAEPPGLRPAERRPAARSARHTATSTRSSRAGELAVDPGRAHGARVRHARDRRALPVRPDDDRAERAPRQGWCAATCATRKATGTTRRRCCARSSRSTTRSISRSPRYCRRSATGSRGSCPSASRRSRTAATSTPSPRATARTPARAARSAGRTGASTTAATGCAPGCVYPT